MVELQERDKTLLRICYEQQFITAADAAKYIFEDRYKVAWRRLASLRKAQLLKSELVHDRVLIFRVTKLGQSAAEESGALPVPQLNRVAPERVNHDRLVTLVRLRLAELWDAKFISEQALEKEAELPDGVLEFASGKKIALEVEASLKGRTRFLKRLRYLGDKGYYLILYVASTEHLFDALQQYLKDSDVRCHVGLTVWSKLESSTPLLWSKVAPLKAFDRRAL